MTYSLPFCEAMRRSQRYFPYWSTSSRTRLMRRTEEPGIVCSVTIAQGRGLAYPPNYALRFFSSHWEGLMPLNFRNTVEK